MRGGVEALKASVAPGPAPVKAQAALRIAAPLLSAPVADRRNWTLARLAEEIVSREGFTDPNVLDQAIHRAVAASNSERSCIPLANQRISA